MKFGGFTALALLMPTITPWQRFSNHKMTSDEKAQTQQLSPTSLLGGKKSEKEKKTHPLLEELEKKRQHPAPKMPQTKSGARLKKINKIK